MYRRLMVVIALACALALAAQPVLAGEATGDLIPDANYPWQAETQHSGPMTAQQIFGSKAGSVKGFVDAYHKVWSQPGQGLVDHLERYSSVFWAAYRFGQSEGAAKKDKRHTSFATVPGFGNGAYEVTDPPDANGFSADVLFFGQGDYLALLIIVRQNGTPDHSALLTQAKAQLATLPGPAAASPTFNNSILVAALVTVGIAAVAAAIAGVVLLVVFRHNRRRRPVVAEGVTYSNDGRYWWDGTAWRPVPPPQSRT